MNRRNFLKTTGFGSLGAMATANLMSVRTSCSPISKGAKPNIIFILADDLGYGDLGCYGQEIIRTPNIDRLAAEGMRFTDHYAGSTVCAPSRCCLMTGYHTGHARVRGNWGKGPRGYGACFELRDEDVTIAELLKQAGYTTGMFGKWSLGVEDTTGEPGKQGFDEWFGYLNQGHAHNYYTEFLWKNNQVMWIRENANGQKVVYSHDLITQESLDFIERNTDNPFFLYLAYTIPHANNEMGRISGDGMQVPSYAPYSAQNWPQPEKGFAAMVTLMDRDIGKIVALLKEKGLDENTIIFFSSDNGPHHEGGHNSDFFKSSGPLRGTKRDLYDGGIRVPMIARWPGKIKPGTETNHVSAFWDFLPTACEIAGIKSPKNIDGISFLPILFGQEQKEHGYLYWEFHERKTSAQAIRMGNWKAVRHSPVGLIELYDLKTDIGEKDNIAQQHTDIVAEMESFFKNARTPHKIWSLKR